MMRFESVGTDVWNGQICFIIILVCVTQMNGIKAFKHRNRDFRVFNYELLFPAKCISLITIIFKLIKLIIMLPYKWRCNYHIMLCYLKRREESSLFSPFTGYSGNWLYSLCMNCPEKQAVFEDLELKHVML